MKFLRIDMTAKTVTVEEVPSAYQGLGGRGLTSILVNTEVPPTCDPLGPDNKLIFAPGLLAGLPSLSSAGRLSVGGKSPLTQGIKEANAGGMAGDKLGHLGLKDVVVEGRPTEDRLYLLHVTAQDASLLPADELSGLGNYETVARLQERFGQDVAIVSIGPAGEMGLAGAGVAVAFEKRIEAAGDLGDERQALIDHRGIDLHRGGAGAARLEELVGVDDEVLAQGRSIGRAGADMLGEAGEKTKFNRSQSDRLFVEPNLPARQIYDQVSIDEIASLGAVRLMCASSKQYARPCYHFFGEKWLDHTIICTKF